MKLLSRLQMAEDMLYCQLSCSLETSLMMMTIRPVVKVCHDFACRKNSLSNSCFILGGRVDVWVVLFPAKTFLGYEKVNTHFL